MPLGIQNAIKSIFHAALQHCRRIASLSTLQYHRLTSVCIVLTLSVFNRIQIDAKQIPYTHTHTHCLYAVRLEILKIVFSHSVLLHFCRCCCWFCSFRYQNHQNHFEHPINCYATNNRDLNKARTTAKHTHTHRTHFDD